MGCEGTKERQTQKQKAYVKLVIIIKLSQTQETKRMKNKMVEVRKKTTRKK